MKEGMKFCLNLVNKLAANFENGLRNAVENEQYKELIAELLINTKQS
jgi:hypothetical protein